MVFKIKFSGLMRLLIKGALYSGATSIRRNAVFGCKSFFFQFMKMVMIAGASFLSHLDEVIFGFARGSFEHLQFLLEVLVLAVQLVVFGVHVGNCPLLRRRKLSPLFQLVPFVLQPVKNDSIKSTA